MNIGWNAQLSFFHVNVKVHGQASMNFLTDAKHKSINDVVSYTASHNCVHLSWVWINMILFCNLFANWLPFPHNVFRCVRCQHWGLKWRKHWVVFSWAHVILCVTRLLAGKVLQVSFVPYNQPQVPERWAAVCLRPCRGPFTQNKWTHLGAPPRWSFTFMCSHKQG